jgi:hypothetical protein
MVLSPAAAYRTGDLIRECFAKRDQDVTLMMERLQEEAYTRAAERIIGVARRVGVEVGWGSCCDRRRRSVTPQPAAPPAESASATPHPGASSYPRSALCAARSSAFGGLGSRRALGKHNRQGVYAAFRPTRTSAYPPWFGPPLWPQPDRSSRPAHRGAETDPAAAGYRFRRNLSDCIGPGLRMLRMFPRQMRSEEADVLAEGVRQGGRECLVQGLHSDDVQIAAHLRHCWPGARRME